MRRVRHPGVIALLLAAPLAAQNQAVDRLAGRLPAEILPAVRAIVDSAMRQGLPADAIVDKAIEGAVKRVPSDRIIGAVRVVYGQLGSAAFALRAAGETPDADAIQAGAFAVNAGLVQNDLVAVLHAEGDRYPAATALRVAGALAAIGVPAGDIVQLVQTNARAGTPVATLLSLPGQVQAQAARGVPPAAAAHGMAQAAARQPPKPPQNPKGQGQGHRP